MLKVETKTLRIDCPAGYSEHDYIPQIDGDILCVIPVLHSYQYGTQNPTWAYTKRQFWTNCETAGYLVFTVYVIYR